MKIQVGFIKKNLSFGSLPYLNYLVTLRKYDSTASDTGLWDIRDVQLNTRQGLF